MAAPLLADGRLSLLRSWQSTCILQSRRLHVLPSCRRPPETLLLGRQCHYPRSRNVAESSIRNSIGTRYLCDKPPLEPHPAQNSSGAPGDAHSAPRRHAVHKTSGQATSSEASSQSSVDRHDGAVSPESVAEGGSSQNNLRPKKGRRVKSRSLEERIAYFRHLVNRRSAKKYVLKLQKKGRIPKEVVVTKFRASQPSRKRGIVIKNPIVEKLKEKKLLATLSPGEQQQRLELQNVNKYHRSLGLKTIRDVKSKEGRRLAFNLFAEENPSAVALLSDGDQNAIWSGRADSTPQHIAWKEEQKFDELAPFDPPAPAPCNRWRKGESLCSNQFQQRIMQPTDPYLLRVTIVGAPSAGKSTLMNRLVKHKVSATSELPQTTRSRILGVLTEGRTQIVFADTPGLVPFAFARRKSMPDALSRGAFHSMLNADLIMVVIDSSKKINTIHPSVRKLLEENESVPSILVLNKIDAVKQKHTLLDQILTLTNGLTAEKPTIPLEDMYTMPPSPEDRDQGEEEALLDLPEFGRNAEQIKATSSFDRDEMPEVELAAEADTVTTTTASTSQPAAVEGDVRRGTADDADDVIGGDSMSSSQDGGSASSGVSVLAADRDASVASVAKDGSGAWTEWDHAPYEPTLIRVDENTVLKVDPPPAMIGDPDDYGNSLHDLSIGVTPYASDDYRPKKPMRRDIVPEEPYIDEDGVEVLHPRWKVKLQPNSYWEKFEDVFLVSAHNGDGLSKLMVCLHRHAKPNSWMFAKEDVSDLDPQDIVEEVIRDHLFKYLKEEIPYQITQHNDTFQASRNCLYISQQLIVTKDKYVRFIAGPQGSKLRATRNACQSSLSAVFRVPVQLKLHISLKGRRPKHNPRDLRAPAELKMTEKSAKNVQKLITAKQSPVKREALLAVRRELMASRPRNDEQEDAARDGDKTT